MQLNAHLQATIKSDHCHLEKAVARVNALSLQHRELTTTIQGLDTSLQASEQARCELGAAFETKLAEVEGLGRQHEEACGAAKRLQADLGRAADERAALEATIAGLRAGLAQKAAEMEALERAKVGGGSYVQY